MKWNEGGQFENPPSGTHLARCIQLIDLGTQTGKYGAKRQVRIVWELPETPMTGKFKPELKGKPFAISRKYGMSLGEKSTLRKDMEDWRGRKFTKEEMATFEPKSILGKPCMLNLVQESDYVNVGNIAPLMKNAKCPKQINPSIYFSLEPEEFDQNVFNALPEKTRTMIANSPEFNSLANGADQEAEPDHTLGDNESNGNDDDCPF